MKFISALALVGVAMYAYASLPQWGWNPHETSQEQTADEMIVIIEPIALECLARLHAEVPVSIQHRHSLAGVTYRTDTARMTAIGDVETCVSVAGVRVTSDEVIIPSSAIIMNRPRVDAVATLASVESDMGFLGELSGLFPGVDDQDGTVPTLYAVAQNIIGSSECMQSAYDHTILLIRDAYEEKYDIDVTILPGTPIMSRGIKGLDVEAARCEVVV